MHTHAMPDHHDVLDDTSIALCGVIHGTEGGGLEQAPGLSTSVLLIHLRQQHYHLAALKHKQYQSNYVKHSP